MPPAQKLNRHGLLHLLGYDHETAVERDRMVPRERRYRSWARRHGIGPGLLQLVPRGEER